MEEMRCNQEKNCCGECENTPSKPKPNKCTNQCCEPIELRCPADISNAICVPVLTERIYDYVCFKSGTMKLVKDLAFKVKERRGAKYGANEICVKDVLVEFDSIGLMNEDKEPRLKSYIDKKEVKFIPDECSPEFECGDVSLYNSYKNKYSISTSSSCCEQGKKTRIAQIGVEFYVCNLVITIRGKIGCEDFEACTTYSGPILNIMDGKTTPLDFIGEICLPSDEHCLNMKFKFDGCIDVDCVSPQEKFNPDPCTNPNREFKADIFSSLLVTEKIYAIVKEELVVYTSPCRIKCNDGNITSNKCK